MNKYEQVPECIIDFHGYTTREAEAELSRLLKNNQYAHIRIITGTGSHRGSSPILREYVKMYLLSRGIRFNPSKREHGGDGALEVFIVQ
jgi:DNA-nicking Smr family endonuclease